MTILDIDKVSKVYGEHRALNEVSLQLEEGQILGLLGPNGAGKTSLIRIINQITAPDQGEVRFKGELLERKHVASMGYLPEERGLYRKMQVGEQAIYLTRLRGYSRSDALKALKPWFEKFELGSWWGKKVEDLSKGMAQKVQFITTVVHEPELLILDEPFSGFDPINTELVREEILELKKKGTSVILSTHNMGSVEAICDNAALINKSKLVLQGQVENLRNQYFDKTYSLSCHAINATLNDISSWSIWEFCQFWELSDNQKEIRLQLNEDVSLNQFLSECLNFIQIQSVNPEIPNMHDIFIRTVKGFSHE